MYLCLELDDTGTPISREDFMVLAPGQTIVDGDKLDPTLGPDKQALFDMAAKTLPTDDRAYYDSKVLQRADGRWWDGTGLAYSFSSAREIWHINAVDANPQETPRSLDVLNFFDPLTAAECADLQDSFDILARLTKGKIFDRIQGVAIVDTQHLVDYYGAKKDEQPKGLFHAEDGILYINLEEIRAAEARNAPHGLDAHTKKIGTISHLKRTVVHEGGHSIMGIRYEGDAIAHNLGHAAATEGLFPGKVTIVGDMADLGWRKAKGGKPYESPKWHLDDAVVAEVGELPPTGYSLVAPGEDDADSFTMVAFGADTSRMPMRVRLVHDAIEKAEGSTMEVESVTLSKEAEDGKPYVPRQRLQAIRLSVYVGKNVLPHAEHADSRKSELLRR